MIKGTKGRFYAALGKYTPKDVRQKYSFLGNFVMKIYNLAIGNGVIIFV
jgi:hypothetical protein